MREEPQRVDTAPLPRLIPRGCRPLAGPTPIPSGAPTMGDSRRAVQSQLLKLLSGHDSEPLPLPMQRAGKFVALDCEMVGIGPPPHKESMLARVSIVNYYGHVLLDLFVKPQEKVTDYRTTVSGITPAHLHSPQAVPFEEAQKRVCEVLKRKVLVGHALHNDEKVLLLSHPKKDTRDTAFYKPFLEAHHGGRSHLSLRKLAKAELGIDIQTGAHSSVEDARCVMALYHRAKNEWEKKLHPH